MSVSAVGWRSQQILSTANAAIGQVDWGQNTAMGVMCYFKTLFYAFDHLATPMKTATLH